MPPLGTGTAGAGSAIIKTDISGQIKAWQQLSSNKPLPQLTDVPPNYLQGAISHIMGRALQGITFYLNDMNVSMKNEDVLNFLLGKIDPSIRFNLPQAATAVYYLYSLIFQGRTPDPNDNMVHISFSELQNASKNPTLQASLYSKVKDGKPDKLFMKNGGQPPAVAPNLFQNSGSSYVAAVRESASPSANENAIHNPTALCALALSEYLPPNEVAQAGAILFPNGGNNA